MTGYVGTDPDPETLTPELPAIANAKPEQLGGLVEQYLRSVREDLLKMWDGQWRWLDDGTDLVLQFLVADVWTNTGMSISIAGDTTVTGPKFIIGKNFVKTPSSLALITAADGITVTHSHMRVEGDGGPIDITANPQIVAGMDGQLVTIEGHSNTNTVTLENGNGLKLHGGKYILGSHDTIDLQYDEDDTHWEEWGRNSNASEKAFSFMSRDANSGTNYVGGFYFFHSGTSTFVAPQTLGTANVSYEAHAFLVCDSSPASDSIIRVSGTSKQDDGTRTSGDTEDLTFLATASANDYIETDKKWIGQITFTFISGDNTVLYNRAFSKYWDNNNIDFKVEGFEATWLGAKNDANPDIKLLHHKTTGWTFTGTTPTPPMAIASMATDNAPEKQIRTDQEGAWKRANLAVNIAGGGSEGTIIELVTTTNRTYAIGNFLLRIRPQ